MKLAAHDSRFQLANATTNAANFGNDIRTLKAEVYISVFTLHELFKSRQFAQPKKSSAKLALFASAALQVLSDSMAQPNKPTKTMSSRLSEMKVNK